MPGKINNLEELRREKELIKYKMQITRQAFFNSLGNNRRQAQRLIVNKIALPVGAGALTSWLIQMLGKKTREDAAVMEQSLQEQPESPAYWWIPLVRTLMRFLDNYLNQIDPPSQEVRADNGHPRTPARKTEPS